VEGLAKTIGMGLYVTAIELQAGDCFIAATICKLLEQCRFSLAARSTDIYQVGSRVFLRQQARKEIEFFFATDKIHFPLLLQYVFKPFHFSHYT
jgi:hypothetical protein